VSNRIYIILWGGQSGVAGAGQPDIYGGQLNGGLKRCSQGKKIAVGSLLPEQHPSIMLKQIYII